jgi:hypothetical protein
MKILIVKAQLFHADEQTDIHDEAILGKCLKTWIRRKCAVYLGKEGVNYILISFACRKNFQIKMTKYGSGRS